MRPLRLLALVALGTPVILLACVGALPVEPPARLLLGWIWFIARVMPGVRVSWEALASSTVCLLAVGVLGQWLGTWYWRESGRTDRWRVKWTVGGLVGVVMMFVAGIAVTGVAHQVVWLAKSDRPLVTRNRETSSRIKCASNLKQIGYAIQLYRGENGGRWPEDLGAVLRTQDVSAEVFICPSSFDEKAPGQTPEEQARNLGKGYLSYRYFGGGWTGDVAADQVVVSEPLDNHDRDGMNVLFGDGHVEFVEGAKAEKLLGDLVGEAGSR